MSRKSLIIAGLFTSLTLHAEAPSYEVHPQLNALAVNYHVESNDIRSILYTTNHEDFDILCDAKLFTDKQEKFKGGEKIVRSRTTEAFAFKHRISVDRIKIYLVCEASSEKKNGQENKEDQETDDSLKSYQAGKMAKPAPVKRIVKEESLDDI